jgi:hypothetical protein
MLELLIVEEQWVETVMDQFKLSIPITSGDCEGEGVNDMGIKERISG